MKSIVLTALNTRHTHSALGLAYIKSYWDKEPCRQPLEIIEFDLNQTNESIIADLIIKKPDILAFSVYIWSLGRILVVAGAMKAAFPEITIILGGPEVSFNARDVLNRCHDVDFIVRGEGEVTFCELLQAILAHNSVESISGLTWRNADEIIDNPDRSFMHNLDEIPSPFRSGAYKGVHSFTYYEASRGCPSRCTYCLSSVLGPVRNHSIERVKADLDWFFSSNYQQVRFADRTFNFDRQRAREIISYILKNNKQCINFHFEIQADFLAEDIIDLLSEAPDGMFHLEIGIQSTNPAALKAVNRRFNLDILRERILQLKKRTSCHLHVDLLGALPFDTLQDFYQSLNDAWLLDPDDIQISLVKVLRGTPLQQLVHSGTVAAMPDPPYTIVRTSWLAPDEAMLIQDVGKLVEGIHNSRRFYHTLRFVVFNCFASSPAAMFASLASFWKRKQLLFYSFSPESTARQILNFVAETTTDRQILAMCRSLIEHELRMTQKIPAGESFIGPEFEPKLKKHPLRVTQGIRVYWYEYNPLLLLNVNEPISADGSPGAVPIVYRFERDLSATPSVEIVHLNAAEAFTLGAIQRRADFAGLPHAWSSINSDQTMPDFADALEKLAQAGLIYEV